MAEVRYASAIFVFVALVVCLSGCDDHLAGTHDATLTYQIYDDVETGKPLGSVYAAQRMKSRLIGAQVTADVDPLGDDEVTVTVDRDLAELVDSLVHWRGGVALYRVDPELAFALADDAALEPRSDPIPGGGVERYYTGAYAAISRAVHAAQVPKGHLLFIERIDAVTSRTRMVVDPPLVDLSGADGISTIGPTDYGRAIAMTFTDSGTDALDTAIAKNPGAHVAVVRDHTLLETRALDSCAASPLVVSFGREITSFTRAATQRRVLTTPTMPVLRRLSATPLASSWPNAIACALIPMIVSLAWLVFVRRFDRARPEPWWLVLVTFAIGAAMTIPAAYAESGLAALTPYLDPHVMSLGGQLIGLPSAILAYTIAVGVVEEGVKLLGAWSLAGHRREFDEPVDGIVYACASALGFAAMENMRYFANARMAGTVVTARAFVSVPAHIFFSAIWGYALGRRLVAKKTSVLGWFLLAAVAHGTFDALLSTDRAYAAAIVLDVVLGLGFVYLLRKALRYGVVPTEEGSAPASNQRAIFSLGSRSAFLVLTALFLSCATLVMTIGTAYEVLHHRVGFLFLAIATTLLGVLGLVAYGLTQAIPLDAAIDDIGLTFAGATSPWNTILRFAKVARPGLLRAKTWLDVETTTGPVRLGPGDNETIERMETVLSGYLAQRTAPREA
jgi:RsiW-degrading membrane proteinase PrsW (M82 family)